MSSNRQIVSEAIGHAMARLSTDVVQQRPVVTTCSICRRPNPCPAHLFVEQVDYNRSRGR